MNESTKHEKNDVGSPQCQFFVVRKKRLCRMTVKPGRQYCGEHEPQPKCNDGKDDTRIPCPNDPKHTCYASKLEKHLSICNARQQEQPDYIVQNINAPTEPDDVRRLPLSKTPLETILKVIEKVNILYENHVEGKITPLPEKPIHTSVLEDFQTEGRTESSLRHLRQASRLLHLVEEEQLVAPNTCYVELGAGKGHLSYYAWWAWCRHGGGRVLLVDRASLRHKRDNKLRDALGGAEGGAEVGAQGGAEGGAEGGVQGGAEGGAEGSVQRVRADLAHLRLQRVPAARDAAAVVGYAKHLCGVATDYALRCLAGAGEGAGAVAGVVIATCCHHRCERAACVAARPLLDMGISGEEFNVMLGIVSWATCGDGRQERARAGRRAKALVDWGRVLYLRQRGFDARLVHYVPTDVSLENVCIVAKKLTVPL